MGWLEAEAEKPGSITGHEGWAVRELTPAGLDALAAGLPVPAALRLLAARPDLARRIRSATSCCLDLGDFAAVTSAGDGRLIHVLSDQQEVLHWARLHRRGRQ